MKALPKMIEKANDANSPPGSRSDLHETENQASVEQVLQDRQTPKGVDCPAIDGLIKEADDVAGEVDDKKVLDAAIIGSAQAVEHYEMSRYGTLIAWAEELGHANVVSLLNANLKEEKAADKKLNALAEGGVNRRDERESRRHPRTKQAERKLVSKRMGHGQRCGSVASGNHRSHQCSLIIFCTGRYKRTPESTP